MGFSSGLRVAWSFVLSKKEEVKEVSDSSSAREHRFDSRSRGRAAATRVTGDLSSATARLGWAKEAGESDPSSRQRVAKERRRSYTGLALGIASEVYS